MQYWNQLDKFDDDELADEPLPGNDPNDGLRDTNPAQQYFDFGETLNPNLDQLDAMSGFGKMDPLSKIHRAETDPGGPAE